MNGTITDHLFSYKQRARRYGIAAMLLAGIAADGWACPS